MRERPFLLDAVEGHGDRVSHAVVDVDDEDLVVVSEKYGATVNGWHYAFYGNLDYAGFHGMEMGARQGCEALERV